MRIHKWTDIATEPLGRFGSTGANHVRLSQFEGQGALSIIRLNAGGRLGRHPASLRQALLIISGSGSASGGDGVRQLVTEGDLLVWEAEEDHETLATEALLAFVLEAEELTIPSID